MPPVFLRYFVQLLVPILDLVLGPILDPVLGSVFGITIAKKVDGPKTGPKMGPKMGPKTGPKMGSKIGPKSEPAGKQNIVKRERKRKPKQPCCSTKHKWKGRPQMLLFCCGTIPGLRLDVGAHDPSIQKTSRPSFVNKKLQGTRCSCTWPHCCSKSVFSQTV